MTTFIAKAPDEMELFDTIEEAREFIIDMCFDGDEWDYASEGCFIAELTHEFKFEKVPEEIAKEYYNYKEGTNYVDLKMVGVTDDSKQK